MRRASVIYVILPILFLVACASGGPRQQAGQVATYGGQLLDAVKVAQDAVIQAEASKALSTDRARQSMEVFKKIGDYSSMLAQELRLYAALDANSAAGQTKAETIAGYLRSLDSLVLDALVPIDQQDLRSQLSMLLKHVSSIILTINSEILKR